MYNQLLEAAVSLALASIVVVEARPTASLAARSAGSPQPFHVLADGTSYQSGDITPNWRWQSSGLLSRGCSESVGIEDCYTMSLSASGDLESTKSSAATGRERVRRTNAIEYGESFESLAALHDDDIESYTSPWNAVEEMWARSPAMMVRRDTAFGRRQAARSCPGGNGNGGGGGSGGGGGGGGGGGTAKPPSPRQRIEMFSWPGARADETWSFSWKSHQGETSVTSKFFHTWQLLRRDCGGGPVVTLDLKGGKAVVSDNVRGCVDCASIDASAFMTRTIEHHLTVTFGYDGRIAYRAYDVTPSSSASSPSRLVQPFVEIPILTYDAQGDMGDQASLKFGQYRAVTSGLRDATTFVGDYTARQVS